MTERERLLEHLVDLASQSWTARINESGFIVLRDPVSGKEFIPPSAILWATKKVDPSGKGLWSVAELLGYKFETLKWLQIMSYEDRCDTASTRSEILEIFTQTHKQNIFLA